MNSPLEEMTVTPELVHAYYDGELEASVRIQVEQAIERSPGLRNELETARFLHDAVGAGLEAAAAAVPEARFEQVWEQIDRALDREARLRAAADQHASIWSRVGVWTRHFRWPAVAAAAAAVVTLVVVRPGADTPDQLDQPNKADQVASVTPVEESTEPEEATSRPMKASEAPLIARRSQDAEAGESDGDPLPLPERNDADLELIEFGGKAGRISRIEGQRGTTTVIWVVEDEPIDSERSL